MQQKKRKRTSASVLVRKLCVLLSVLSLFTAVQTTGFAKNSDYDAMSDRNEASKYEGMKLCPGGMAFGVKFFTKGVLVVGISDVKSGEKETKPAYDAGIRVRDVIISVDGTEVNSVKEFSEIIENSAGKGLLISLIRNGKQKEVTLYPSIALTEMVNIKRECGFGTVPQVSVRLHSLIRRPENLEVWDTEFVILIPENLCLLKKVLL